MINITDERDRITTALETYFAANDIAIKVYPLGVDGSPAFPAVFLGLPETDLNTDLPCVDRTTIPVAVAVRRDGTNERATAKKLDELVVATVAALRAGMEPGGAIDGSTAEVVLTRAAPADMELQGASLPAHLIELDYYG